MGRKSVCMVKKMRNRRYRKTEEAILKVFFVESERGVSFRGMAKKAGIGRTTMYIHHHAIREILPDYRQYMLAEYSIVLKRKMREKNTQLKLLYFEMLVFILKHKKIFEMFLKFEDRETLVRMIKRLEFIAVNAMRMPKNSRKIFQIYTSEVVEIIFEWGEERFSQDKMDRVLKDIMYLTETARDRLMPIV